LALEPERLATSKQELSALLKELRIRAGLTGDRLARRCNMSQSKISRIETGKVLPGIVDVERILRAVGSPPDLAEEAIRLARVANTEWQDLRSLRRKGVHRKQDELADLEASSLHIRYFLLSMITGLLSTPAYIRATLSHLGQPERDRVLARKIERQRVLSDTSKRFTFILTEQAVRWPLVPPSEMDEQIARLMSLSLLPNLRIGVIPLAGLIPLTALDTFTIYDETLATVETTTGIVILRDSRDTPRI
jgi:transcriptional regulator with XRE-family HTH domain